TGNTDPNDAYNEADHFVMRVLPYYQGSGLMLRPVLDLEHLAGVGNTAAEKAFLSEWVRKWVSRVTTGLNGIQPIIYANAQYSQLYYAQDISQNALWFAKPINPTPNDPTDSAFQNDINN